jgi:hypothetical protein
VFGELRLLNAGKDGQIVDPDGNMLAEFWVNLAAPDAPVRYTRYGSLEQFRDNRETAIRECVASVSRAGYKLLGVK